jgi:VanZ family protein
VSPSRAGPLARTVAWAAVGAYMALIFYLSSLSNPLPELTARVWDKALHATEYAGLACLVAWALLLSGATVRRALATAALGASLYGASDEIHQAVVPNRDSEVSDWAADTVGGALGAALGVAGVSAALRVRGARASIRRDAPREVP